MVEKQSVCLRQLGGSRSGEMRFGRWLSNKKVTKEEMIETVCKKTKELTKNIHVLGIQDTTEINYQSHVNKVKGLGTVGNGTDIGFFMHPMLMLDAEDGSCFGFGDIQVWLRHGEHRKGHSRRPIEEKESLRWITTAQETKARLSEAKMLTIIADRESDIYEEWHRVPDERTHLITRACRDRRLNDNMMLFAYIDNESPKGTYEVEVKERTGKRSAHKAKLEIRFGEIEIKKPTCCTDKQAPEKIKLRFVDVKELEETVIKGEEPIHWRLLTTHRVENNQDALQIVNWYCQRWNIEQLFRTLKKQGIDIESSQMETANGLVKLGVLAIQAALKIMQLTLARGGKDQSITVVFNGSEREVLAKLQRKLEGKTEKQKNPHSPDKLSWAAWTIARLGGWKGYKTESPPGPITMSRGFRQFQSLCDGYRLAKDVCID